MDYKQSAERIFSTSLPMNTREAVAKIEAVLREEFPESRAEANGELKSYHPIGSYAPSKEMSCESLGINIQNELARPAPTDEKALREADERNCSTCGITLKTRNEGDEEHCSGCVDRILVYHNWEARAALLAHEAPKD